MKPMLEAIDLTCGYDKRFLLQGINLSISKGEALGIIGPNGSGKTTLIKALTRTIYPMKGSVLFEGKDIWKISLKEFTKKVAVVSQETHKVSMKIQDYVLLGRIPHYRSFQFLETRRDLEVALQAMKLAGILHLKERALAEVSGGERQLALIARALAQEPRLLVLDEPVAHLDIGHQIRVLRLLNRLKGEMNLTVVIVFHELNLASEFCDRLLLLKEGRALITGTPQQVLTPQILKEIYEVEVFVERHPLSHKPYVLLSSQT